MQIRQHGHACPRGDLFFELNNVDLEVVFESSRKTFDLRAEVFGDREQGLVSWLLDQDFVAVLEQHCHRKVVCHRRATGNCDDIFGSDMAMRRECFDQRAISVSVVAV